MCACRERGRESEGQREGAKERGRERRGREIEIDKCVLRRRREISYVDNLNGSIDNFRSKISSVCGLSAQTCGRYIGRRIAICIVFSLRDSVVH